MASHRSHHFDFPQLTVVDIQDVTNSSPPDNPFFPTSGPPVRYRHSGTRHFLLLPSLVPTNNRTHPGVPGSPSSRTSDASSSYPPPSSTHSAASRDNNPNELHGLSFLTPPTRECKFPVLSVSIGTDSDANGSASLGFPVASFLNRDRIVRCVYYPSPSPSGDTGMGSDTTRYDSIMEGDKAGVRLDSAEADLNIDPFAFKPLELVALVDSKSLENLESFGGVEGLLHGLGTNRHRGLNTIQRLRQSGLLDPETRIRGINSAAAPFGVELAPRPSFGGNFVVDHYASLERSVPYEATIEDRQRVYGYNMPCRPSKRLSFFMWLATYDRVLVSPAQRYPTPFPLNLISASGFFVDCYHSFAFPWRVPRLQFNPL